MQGAQEWLQWARDDAAAAAALRDSSDAQPRHACFMAQQAAEKAIKASLVLEQTPFPFVHDLTALKNLLSAGWDLHASDADLDWLTEWAVEARYPHEVTARAEHAVRAVEIADSVCGGVESEFRSRGVV